MLIIPSTGEESIEAYAIRVFEQWKLGRKGVDDGILLLVARTTARCASRWVTGWRAR